MIKHLCPVQITIALTISQRHLLAIVKVKPHQKGNERLSQVLDRESALAVKNVHLH